MILAKNERWKRRIAIISVAFLIAGIALAVRFFPKNSYADQLKERALVIVVENNFGIPVELEEYYGEHKDAADAAFSFLFKTDKNDFVGMSLAEIIDDYGEDYLAGRYAKAAEGYGKVVFLTDEKASYKNFEDTLADIGTEGKVIDILLDLHGGEDAICFYGECIDKDMVSFTSSIKSSNPPELGFVYQTLCYGGQNMEPWIRKGAKAVNGAEGLNNFVVFAPERFLKSWTRGKTFSAAVEDGREFELKLYGILRKFTPGILLEEECIDSSQMLFFGDKDYSL